MQEEDECVENSDEEPNILDLSIDFGCISIDEREQNTEPSMKTIPFETYKQLFDSHVQLEKLKKTVGTLKGIIKSKDTKLKELRIEYERNMKRFKNFFKLSNVRIFQHMVIGEMLNR